MGRSESWGEPIARAVRKVPSDQYRVTIRLQGRGRGLSPGLAGTQEQEQKRPNRTGMRCDVTFEGRRGQAAALAPTPDRRKLMRPCRQTRNLVFQRCLLQGRAMCRQDFDFEVRKQVRGGPEAQH
ncbi:hypothetical protein AAFF_G00048390 [Aldrovandia affinis]|uniref:Uncharacterized protein n=1 Tax=Aldrovandia affinis TaxID=143900 RepID=A0AAD7WEM2_9TELE|nr:hypothetical protein AAFF_G00048390 [Aldrovandia affinis]